MRDILAAACIALCLANCGALCAAPAGPRAAAGAGTEAGDTLLELQPWGKGGSRPPELQQRAWSGNCTYEGFGSTPFLRGVQVLPTRTAHLPFVKFDHGGGLEGLFVHPASKVAMCTIEKNGCSTWTNFWTRVVTNDLNASGPNYDLVSTHWSEENATAVFEDRGSTRIAWVREPLARFLSGFLNKCAKPCEYYEGICSFHGGSDPGFPLARAMDWFTANHSVKELNEHFSPQFMHCELSRRLQEYNLIGLMTKASFAEDATCLLERAQLGWWNRKGGRNGGPYFTTPANAKEKARREVEILKKFFTKDFARYLMDSVFAEDYRLFRIERPAWVENATGEWFRTRPPISTDPLLPQGNLAQADADPDEDEDDIEELAAKLGYILDN